MNARPSQLSPLMRKGSMLAFVLVGLGLGCGDKALADSGEGPSALPNTGTGPSPTPKPSPAPEGRVKEGNLQDPQAFTAHSAQEALAHPQLAKLSSLDLALSSVDARTRPLRKGEALVEGDQCQELDLRKLAERAPNLRHLRISGCQAAVHAGLHAFTELRRLDLADLTLDEVTLDRIAALQHLEHLELTRVQATEASTLVIVRALNPHTVVLRDLERDSLIGDLLGDLPSLRKVRLEGEWAGHRAMLSLNKAKQLETLELVDTSVGNFSLNQVKLLGALRHVVWVGDTFNDNSPLYLRDLPVEVFECECSKLGDRGLAHLRYLPGLKQLRLERSEVSAGGLAPLAKLEALETLFLGDQDIGVEGFAAIAKLDRLRKLELAGGSLLDAELPGIDGLTQVKELTLRLKGLGDTSAEQLAALTQLEALYLSDTEISDDGLEAFAELHTLRTLDLGGTRITNQGLQHLQGLRALESLALNHTDLVDAGVAHLSGLSQLKELRVDHTLVTDACVHNLEKLTHLERLNVSGTVISSSGAQRLRRMPNLKSIDLSDSRATDLR